MPPTTTAPGSRLICLCASRIRTRERIRYLRYFLTSVSEQTTKDFKLFLGISFDTPELRKEFDGLAITLPSTVHIFLSSKKQSQFERYRSIFQALRTTNDDDLWSPHRMEAYEDSMQTLYRDPRKPPFSFNITHFHDQVENQDLSHWSEIPKDPKGIYQAPVPREYADILCTHAVFAKWFTVASPELLAHVTCDLAFTRWMLANFKITNDRQERVHFRMDNGLPIYWYRQHEQGDGSRVLYEDDDMVPSFLLHERLSTRNMGYSKEELLDQLSHQLHLTRAGWVELWKQCERSPLWHHIFCDLLGEGSTVGV